MEPLGGGGRRVDIVFGVEEDIHPGRLWAPSALGKGSHPSWQAGTGLLLLRSPSLPSGSWLGGLSATDIINAEH